MVCESVDQAENLVVPKAGIKGDLGDEIGRRIGRVSSPCVEAIAGAGLAEQEIVRVVVRGECGLRVFHGDSDREFIAKVLGQANPVLTRESEPDVVTRVDRRGPGIVDFAQVVAGRDPRFALGYQTPHLAAEEFPAIVKLGLGPRLAEAESIAVGLGRGGSDARREKVTRYVTGESPRCSSGPRQRA